MAEADEGGRADKPAFRRLERSELLLLGIPLLIGVAIPVLWQMPIATFWPLFAAVILGFAFAFLPKVPRTIGFWVVGMGGGLACAAIQPALTLSWLMLFPSFNALGGHVRAVREQR